MTTVVVVAWVPLLVTALGLLFFLIADASTPARSNLKRIGEIMFAAGLLAFLLLSGTLWAFRG